MKHSPATRPTFTAETPHGRVSGWRAGSGPPTLLLHGGPGMTDYTEGLAAELEDAFGCIRYQQRGVAPSTTGGPKDVHAHVADALAVLDALGIERALIVGHSWGGHLAAHVVATHPERALGLVSICGIGAIRDGGWAAFDEEMARRLPPERAALVEEIDRRLYAGEGTFEDEAEMMRLTWPAYFPPEREPPPLPEFDFDAAGYAETHASVVKLAKTGDLARRLATLDKPALFVHGEFDPIPRSAVEETAGIMKGSHIEILEGIGHFPWLERPGATGPVITRWWERVGLLRS